MLATRRAIAFIDSTDKNMRLGKLAPRLMAGNHALVLDSEPRLLKIPDYQDSLMGVTIERDVNATADGFLTVTESTRLTGYQAAELRAQLRDIETSEMHRSLQSWVAGRYSDAELTDLLCRQRIRCRVRLALGDGISLADRGGWRFRCARILRGLLSRVRSCGGSPIPFRVRVPGYRFPH